ncbi:putative acetyltransferase [Congregibacter litoralis KT71]|uniref:Putative acetyltransferase n=2 Tax=Congregibacter TaxID=393661 RepID=A4A331_9GAMM|nr:putative acetyltransferase [Congregibacter litoralis KT71]
MQFSTISQNDTDLIVQLYKDSFSEAEGPEEGAAIAKLVRSLLAEEELESIIGFVAADQQGLEAAIIFSPLSFAKGDAGFLLSPVAVRSKTQGQGIGSRLIRHGLEALKAQGHDIVFTYGDPAYYSRFGFVAVSHEKVVAPYPLSMPVGWLAVSLKGDDVTKLEGRLQCVRAFDNPDLW